METVLQIGNFISSLLSKYCGVEHGNKVACVIKLISSRGKALLFFEVRNTPARYLGEVWVAKQPPLCGWFGRAAALGLPLWKSVLLRNCFSASISMVGGLAAAARLMLTSLDLR